MEEEETLADFQNFCLRGSQILHAGDGKRLFVPQVMQIPYPHNLGPALRV